LDPIAELRAVELRTGGEGLKELTAYRASVATSLMKEVAGVYGPAVAAAVEKSLP
jgi:hypothetical protein